MGMRALHQGGYAGISREDTAGLPAVAHRFDTLVDAECPQNWDEFASGFDDACYDQTVLYSNLRWGEDQMSAIALRQGGTVVAAVIMLPGFPIGIAFIRGGPMWRLHGRPVDAGIYRRAVKAIRANIRNAAAPALS